ncbi:CLUMA_CG010257, isoform A [Clunio marinus]|uniref:CLUMA_CG010257, isoform A n=1 Tax=Clunio marinus TaxID=568069 RepID=A0A1J1IDT6_9DIPT|nr:CLUMA_CG010257, isoform A [Clunio marinus]
MKQKNFERIILNEALSSNCACLYDEIKNGKYLKRLINKLFLSICYDVNAMEQESFVTLKMTILFEGRF